MRQIFISARSKLPPRPVLSFSSPSPPAALTLLLSPDSVAADIFPARINLLSSALPFAPSVVSRHLVVLWGSVERRLALAMASLSMTSSLVSYAAVFAAPGAASSSAAAGSLSTSSAVRVAPVNRRFSVVAMAATPQNKEDVKDRIPNAIAEAQKTCEDDPTSAPCAVAWDEVEELTAEASHQRDRKKTTSDPLETYCADNPETDECRTYED